MTDNKNFEMNDQELEKAAGGEYGYAGGGRVHQTL